MRPDVSRWLARRRPAHRRPSERALPKLAAAFAAWCAVVASASAARAALDDSLQLHWDAPAACPSESDVVSDVARLVGSSARPEANLVAHASVERAEHGAWRLLLETELDGTAGERELEGTSCQAVARAAAVLLALMLNPDAETDAAAPSSAPERARWGVELGANVSRGVLPEWTPGVALGLVGRLGSGWVLLGAAVGLPTYAALSSDPEQGGDLWLVSGRAGVCWDVLGDQLAVATCALGRVHRVEGRGHGIANPRTAAVWWPDLGVGVSGRAALTESLALQGHLRGALPLSRPALFIEELGVVHRAEALDTSLELGVLFQFR